MLEQILSLLPARWLSCSAGVAMLLALAGGALWITGARFTRSLITLGAVATGTIIGLHLPGWLGWSIDGMALAVGGAVVLGSSGYLLDRGWVGFALGAMLALWSAAGVRFVLGSGAALQCDYSPAAGGLIGLIARQQSQLPTGVGPALLLSAAAAFAIGILLTVLSPRFSQGLLWSLAGLTLLVPMGGIALRARRPDWIAGVSVGAAVEWAALLGLAVIGALGQCWQTRPRQFKDAGASI